MSRFATTIQTIGNFEGIVDVNVDKVAKFWRVLGRNDILRLQLDNGETMDVLDKHFTVERELEGRDHVVQVIPPTYPLYARYEGDEKGDIERPIRYLGLCANGDVRPLELCNDGLCFADEADDFIGLREGEGYKITKRYVAALEGINDRLDSISSSLRDASSSLNDLDHNIDGCVALTGRANEYVFRIAGDVFTN